MKRFDGHHCFKYQASIAQKGKQGFLIPAILTGLTTLCGISLSTPSTMAESSSASAAVTVVSACSLSATNTVPHTASIPPGTYQADIGSTTLKAFCNDQGGFAIYAIGYTDTTYGKNTLTANINNELIPSSDIATGTATSGSTSNWAMKLATNSGATYPISLNNGFGVYSAVPASYTKVASRESGTDAGSGATGSELTTTYAAFIKSGQEAGTYSGKVKYTMVHPSNESAPPEPQPTTAGYINYYANATAAEGTMGRQAAKDGDTVTLFASNFSRNGYGFAGWSDSFDYDTNPDAHFYGPNEDITVPNGTTANGLALYAVWVKSVGNLQNTAKVAELCGSGGTGGSLTAAVYNNEGDADESTWSITAGLSSVSALTDARDGQTYAIAKLADNKCWMIENLRLADTHQEGTNTVPTILTTTNTNNPLNDNNSTNPTVTLKHNYSDTDTYPTLSSTSSDAASWCTTNSAACDDQSRLRTDNTANRASYTTTQTMSADENLYSYGNYYNWYSATAGRGTYSKSSGDTVGDICPVGWILPRGGKSPDKEFWGLIVVSLNDNILPANYNVIYPNYSGEEAANVLKKVRSFPNNFIHSGWVSGANLSYRGTTGTYRTPTPSGSGNSLSLSFTRSSINPGTNNSYKYTGVTVRCVAEQ